MFENLNIEQKKIGNTSNVSWLCRTGKIKNKIPQVYRVIIVSFQKSK